MDTVSRSGANPATTREVDTVLIALGNRRDDQGDCDPIENAARFAFREDTLEADRRRVLAAIATKCKAPSEDCRATALGALWHAAWRGCADAKFIATLLREATLDERPRIRRIAWQYLTSPVIVRCGEGAEPIQPGSDRRGLTMIRGLRDYALATDELRALRHRHNSKQDHQYLMDLQAIIREFHDYTLGQARPTPQQMLRYLIEAVRQTTVGDVQQATGVDLGRFFRDQGNLDERECKVLAHYFHVHADAFGAT